MLNKSQIQPVYRQQSPQQTKGGGLGKTLGAVGAVVGGIAGAAYGGNPVAGASAGASLGGMAGGLIDPARAVGGGSSVAPSAPLQTPQFSENGRAVADAMQALQALPTEYRTEFQGTLASALLKDLASQGQGRMA